jgi:hypothetical protein
MEAHVPAPPRMTMYAPISVFGLTPNYMLEPNDVIGQMLR